MVDEAGRIVMPKDDEIRTLVLSEAHDSPLAGHFGIEKTLELVQRKWTWKGLQKDVKDYVQSCLRCQRAKSSTHKTPGELHPILATRPWEILTLDFVSGLPTDPRTKFSQILVMVDKFTKYVMLEPCLKEVSAADTAQIFIKRVVRDHGVPAVVISDRGPQFAAQVWKGILQSLGARSALATTHHPQTDGQSERVIRTLTQLLRTYVSSQTGEWVQMIPLLQFCLNNSASASTHLSPFQILYGRTPLAPVNLLLADPEGPPGSLELRGDPNVGQWARKWWKARRKLCDFVRANLRITASRMKRRYDSHRRKFHAEPGDLVLLSTKSLAGSGEFSKLKMRYTGPYPVKRQVHAGAYELEGLPQGVPSTQNVSFLRLFHPTPARFESRPIPSRAVGPVSDFRDHLEWEVARISAHKEVRGANQYLIHWKDHEEPTWLRLPQLQNCAELLREYQAEHGIDLSFWDEEASSSDSEEEDFPEDDASEANPVESQDAPQNSEAGNNGPVTPAPADNGDPLSPSLELAGTFHWDDSSV